MAADVRPRARAPAPSRERGATLIEMLFYLMIAGLLVSAIALR